MLIGAVVKLLEHVIAMLKVQSKVWLGPLTENSLLTQLWIGTLQRKGSKGIWALVFTSCDQDSYFVCSCRKAEALGHLQHKSVCQGLFSFNVCLYVGDTAQTLCKIIVYAQLNIFLVFKFLNNINDTIIFLPGWHIHRKLYKHNWCWFCK